MLSLLFKHFYITDTTAMMASGVSIFIFIAVIGLLTLAERVLLGLAVYNDACSKGNPDATMWGLLVGFFGFIPGIIYLCIRNSSKQFVNCSNCGLRHPAMDMNCPRCGAPSLPPYANPYTLQQAHRAKVFLIISICLFVVMFIASIVFVISFVSCISSLSEATVY